MEKLISLFLLLPSLVLADVVVKGGGTTNQAKVNTSGSLQVNEGPSLRPTYIASSSALVTTAAFNVSVEAGASVGFKVSQVCVGVSNATAAAAVTVAMNRRSTASSGGTALTVEGTGADSISKMDPSDGNWPGAGRRTATLGTIGPTLDQWGFMVGELGAGTADSAGPAISCRIYGRNGEKLPTVVAGTTNGLSVTVTAPGAGGLASGSISLVLIAE